MNVWVTAAQLLAYHLSSARKLDALLETLPRELSAENRRRCLHLVYGVVRHRALLEFSINAHVQRPPRPPVRAALLLGAFELLEHPESVAVIVHHAVDQTRELATEAEARMVNAVLRRVGDSLAAVLATEPNDVAGLALRYSHPEWLVSRWHARWGLETTRQALRWNQQPAVVHARRSRAAVEAKVDLPPGFVSTSWPDFFRLERPEWAEVERLLADGSIYLQDPATALAPDLLAAFEGETVLDLCAAPGGKTFQLAEAVGATGRVVAVDMPGPRLERFRSNLRERAELRATVFAGDATKLQADALAAAELPTSYDAVLIDVPCSNTGVLRHRVDAKWRLRSTDIETLPARQLTMLQCAADFVRPGGRLVYSTCSLEPEENEGVVEAFLATAHGAFTLERTAASRPWESSCDGAGAFLLRRKD